MHAPVNHMMLPGVQAKCVRRETSSPRQSEAESGSCPEEVGAPACRGRRRMCTATLISKELVGKEVLLHVGRNGGRAPTKMEPARVVAAADAGRAVTLKLPSLPQFQLPLRVAAYLFKKGAPPDEAACKVDAIEAPGPRLAFSEGLAKAVLCQVYVVELDCPACEGEQLRHLLQVVPEGDNSWILFSAPGGIWHPGRSGFFRNFTRQVPGKRKCTSTVAPLIVRPVQAVPLLRSAVEVNRRLQLPDGDVEVMEEARHAVQYCVRRTLLSQFLDTWTHVQFTNEQCFDQLWAFIVEENAEKCFQVATTQLYEGASQGATPLWMYYAPWQRERAG
ncbi:Cyt-b5 [Symbiodinium sp. CCMP2592]|nr:Cyt-b5 [Symbiodinium sp. CCMP2592]